MVIIKQVTNYTCTLACIQSFLADNFITITQQDLIPRFPVSCMVGTKNEGAFQISRDTFAEVGNSFGFDVVELNAISEPAERECLLIVPRDYLGQHIVHTVRYHKRAGVDSIWVMDPSSNRNSDVWAFSKWTDAEVAAWACLYFKFKMR